MRMTYFVVVVVHIIWVNGSSNDFSDGRAIALRSTRINIIIIMWFQSQSNALIWSCLLIAFNKNAILNMNEGIKMLRKTRNLICASSPSFSLSLFIWLCAMFIFILITKKKSNGHRNGISSFGIGNESYGHVVTQRLPLSSNSHTHSMRHVSG